jgi:hypothetical protein
MSADLRIVNLSISVPKKAISAYDFLPTPPMRMILIGASHSGKSNLIKNLLTRPQFGLRDYFTDEGIFVISETLGSEKGGWEELKLPKYQ